MAERKYAPKDAPVVTRDENGKVTFPVIEKTETPEARLARKQKVQVVPPPELLNLTVEELNIKSDELDKQRAEIMQQKREIAEARRIILEEEHAAYYGLTVEQYNEVKAKARDSTLTKELAKARKDAAKRNLQVAKATVATTRAKAKK